MTYAGQTDFKTRAASLGAVAALHGVVAVALITGLAAYQTIVPETHTAGFNMPLPPPPQPEPSIKPEPNKPIEHETVIALPNDPILPDLNPPRPLPTDTVIAKPTPDPLPLAKPTPKGIFKAPIPRGRPADWATPDDYPALDLRLEHEGVARFNLAIGADGRVTSCTITGSSGWPGLDNATCALVSRNARFNPAMDEDGKPANGSYTGAIRWVIPR